MNRFLSSGTMAGLSTEELDERVAALFMPDALLRAQFPETVRSKTHLEAEQ